MIIDCVLYIVLSCFRKEARSYLLPRRASARTERRARKKEAHDAISVACSDTFDEACLLELG